MSAPKTLGQRIQRWGMWAISPLDNTEPVESSGTIADYADACERLAKAAISADDTYKRWVDADPDSEHQAYKESEAADDEYDAALTDYRKLVTAGGAA